MIYSLATILKLEKNSSPNLDDGLVLNELVKKYFVKTLFKPDEQNSLNFNSLNKDEESTAELLHKIILKTAVENGIKNEDLDSSIKDCISRLNIISDGIDVPKVCQLLEERLVNASAEIKTYGKQIFGTVSEIMFNRGEAIPESFIGVIVLKGIDDNGQRKVEIVRGAFANELDTYSILNAISSENEDKNIDINFRISPVSDKTYSQRNCELKIFDYLRLVRRRYKKLRNADIISSFFIVLKGEEYGELMGNLLRGHNRSVSLIYNAQEEDVLYAAAYAASRYYLFNNIKIKEKTPAEFLNTIEICRDFNPVTTAVVENDLIYCKHVSLGSEVIKDQKIGEQ